MTASLIEHYTYDLDLGDELHDMVAIVKANVRPHTSGGAHLTPDNLHMSNVFAPLVHTVTGLCAAWWRFDPFLTRAQAWGIMMKPGMSAISHTHEPKLFSAVVYLTEGAPLILEAMGDSQYYELVQPKPGLLVSFRGNQPHRIPRQEGDRTRYSIGIAFG